MTSALPTRRPKRADTRRNFDTLYRNFPTREDLVAEVHRGGRAALLRRVRVGWLEPWDALVACRKAMRDAGAPAQRLRGAAVSRT